MGGINQLSRTSKGGAKIDVALLTLIVLLTACIVIALWKGRWSLLWSGLQQAGRSFRMMWARVLLGMLLGGFIQVLIPKELIAQWLGPASGLKGILIGSYIGLFVSGGPYVIMPIIASVYHAGAGPGPVIALLSGGMLAIQGLITWQIPLLGLRLSIAQYIVLLFFPPVLGLAGGALFQILHFT